MLSADRIIEYWNQLQGSASPELESLPAVCAAGLRVNGRLGLASAWAAVPTPRVSSIGRREAGDASRVEKKERAAADAFGLERPYYIAAGCGSA
jgi:hypothetical protein